MSPAFTPRLRPLEVLPLNWQGRSSLLLRDPLGYSQETLVVPQVLGPVLALMDGHHDLRDLQAAATRVLGRLVLLEEIIHLVEKLDRSGFLEGENFERLRRAAEESWRREPVRPPACAGQAYPQDPESLRRFLDEILSSFTPQPRKPPRILIAPHLDLRSGARGFAAAYRALELPPGARVILLGTGHQLDAPLSLLLKDMDTPLGKVRVDRTLTSRLMEALPVFPDHFAHRREHSLEFQTLFLRHLFSEFKVVPFLVGSMEPYLLRGEDPLEAQPLYRKWAEVLRKLWDERTYMILGIDFAHLGKRYGDAFFAGPQEGSRAVARDRQLMETLFRGDYRDFLEEARRSLSFKICGLSSLILLRAFLEGYPFTGEIYYQEAVPFGPGSLVSILAAGIWW